ncbi:MAG: response regulator [Anaeromyxobacter sp.]
MTSSSEPQRRRILVVDDNALTRSMISDIAAAAGFEPVIATSGEEAIRLVMQQDVQVAVVDQILAGITGAEFIRWTRTSPNPAVHTLPVVAVSGRFGSEQEMMAAGACCFLQKPFDEPRLVKALRWAADTYPRGGASEP